ncbi:MAG: hypothetical protein HY046_06875 [Acidobacteria bacterium]|nr:hypothetical protein [Acidobacteriota bacterium]
MLPEKPKALDPKKVSILIIDDDRQSQLALHHVLDSEGWRVRISPMASQGLSELATGKWTLAIVNVSMIGVEGEQFDTLRAISLAPASEGEQRRTRILFLVPELAIEFALPALERDRLPFAVKPVNLGDFLEKVSDLMMESQTLLKPIRRVKYEFAEEERRRKDRRLGDDRRGKPMFATHESYEFSEEEISEYEAKEAEAAKARRAAAEASIKDLGRDKKS